ncbi:MAG: DsrE/DsrF/DrsH-like family protein, partial [Rubrivivax sp.]|nr:DsrE/DsrF/DrsH-like family protein [Rubrivivax sp.]
MAAKKMAIIATKGALDMAYPPLILSSTAAALGWEVQVFFTFYGLQLLRKDLSGIAISPLANPAMPMPVPMPVVVSMLPGMEAMATSMMKAKMKKKGV